MWYLTYIFAYLLSWDVLVHIPYRYIMKWFVLIDLHWATKKPDSKVHGVNMGPIWGRQDPGGPHVGPMKFAIWDPIFAQRQATLGFVNKCSGICSSSQLVITLIPTWTITFIIVWAEIAYQFPQINGASPVVWEWISNSISFTLYWGQDWSYSTLIPPSPHTRTLTHIEYSIEITKSPLDGSNRTTMFMFWANILNHILHDTETCFSKSWHQ